MSRAWVFADDGSVWPDGHPSLADELGTRRMGSSLTDFVVRNMGFVRLEERVGAPQLRYSPLTVSTAALDRVLGWLDGRRQTRLVVTSPTRGGPILLLASRAQIVAWIDGVRASRPANASWPPPRRQAATSR